MESPGTCPWRMGDHAGSCKALGSCHGVLLGEQHRCEGSVPLVGVQKPWGHLWASGVPWQSCKQGLSAGSGTLRAALFPSQPSRFVSGRNLPTNQGCAVTNGHFQSHFSDPHQHFKTHLICNWHLYTANFRNVLLWRKDWSTEVIIPPLLAASGVMQLAGNVRDVQHVKGLQQTQFPRALEHASVLLQTGEDLCLLQEKRSWLR